MPVSSVNVTGISGYNVAPAESTHSLQAYIELSYVQTANSVLVNSLASLDSALGTTTGVINVLAGLQTLKNLITIKTTGPFQMPQNTTTWQTVIQTEVSHKTKRTATTPGGNVNISGKDTNYATVTQATEIYTSGGTEPATSFEQVYVRAASAFFNQVTQFSVTYNAALPQSTAITQFISLANQLSADIKSLASTTPMLSTTLSKGTVTHSIDPNSLLAKAKAVLADIRNSVAGGGSGLAFTTSINTAAVTGSLQSWITDSYDKPSSTASGKYQQDLTYAVTAAQSLNNTQTSSVQNYLYIFQQYYQSAAALITAINQIITQMANNIKQ